MKIWEKEDAIIKKKDLNIYMDKPKLYVMVGISASGKSTIAKQIAKENDCEIVSSDDIRGEICKGGVPDQSKNSEVFTIFYRRIREYLNSGKNVIADATNITMKSRRVLLQNVKKVDCYKIAYVVPKQESKCVEDNKNRNFPVSSEVIQKQVMRFQVPFFEEGFDEIEVHEFEKEYNLSVLEIAKKMQNFDQLNPHHTMRLDKHCAHTALLFGESYPYEYIMAAHIHDIGKLFTQTIDDKGVAHYYRHENVGSYYLLSNYNNLLLDKACILDMCFLINYHMLPMSWNSDKTRQKWKRIFGEYKYNLLLDFNRCDKAR